MADNNQNGRNKTAGFLFKLCFMLLFLCIASGCSREQQRLVEISEVVSDNDRSFVDEVYGSPDWIELHNAGSVTVSLNGWFLTDKYDELKTECCLPSIVLEPGEYCILFADKDGAEKGARCLPFGVSRDGESLYLFDDSGNPVCSLAVPALERDVSWAKADDGTFGYCLSPTPAKANTTKILSKMPDDEETAAAADNELPLANATRSDVPIRINEVCSAPSDGENDWIELFNGSNRDLSLEGFFLSDDPDEPQKAVLPAWTVPANGYLVISLGTGADIQTGIDAFSLSSKGEQLYLFDGSLALIDGIGLPALHRGLVYARNEDGSFGYCGEPTPGEQNSSLIFDEPLRTMRAESPIHINEALYRNKYSQIDAYGDHSDWIELVNRGNRSVSLRGYYLSDDREDYMKWALPDVSLAPGAYLLVYLSGKDSTGQELHAPFSVSESDGGCWLYCANTLELEEIPYPAGLKENVSVGLNADGDPVFYAYPTPGYDNAQAFADQEACGKPIGNVIISEVCAAAEEGDWVELFNRGDQPEILSEWYLSNDADERQKLSLNAITILPGAYHVVLLENETSPFSVSLSGSELILTDADGQIADHFETGALRYGITSGRYEDDAACSRVFFLQATKGAKNEAPCVEGYAHVPILSDTALYHAEPFLLTMHTDDPDAVIYYTLDGSAPTDHSLRYSEPVSIDRNTTVRAIATSQNRLMSDEASADYLFREPHTLPVICVAADPARWDLLTQVPFREAGLKEQPARLAYYEIDGTLGTVFPAGISPRGNASLSYPQKSLSVHLRSEYGQKAVTYPFFGEGSFLTYRFLVLRNGSQDINAARMRDSFANRAAENLHVISAMTRPVIVYVNGEYYGIMDLNEGLNQSYFWTHFNKESNEINLVQRNDHVKHGSAEGFVALRAFASGKRLSDPENMQQFSEMADVDAITDYIIAQSFFGNYDIHNQNWVSSTDGSIPWQPYLYDIDRCLNQESFSSNVLYMYFDSHGVVHDRQGDRIMMEIPCGLKNDKTWSKAFVERYAQLLCTEFSEKRLLALLDEMEKELRPEMEAHIAKWKMPNSVESWERSVKEFREYISKRYAYIVPKIKSLFNVSDAEWDALIAKYSS